MRFHLLPFFPLLPLLFLFSSCARAPLTPAVAMERGNPQRRGERFEQPPRELKTVLWRFPIGRGDPGPLLVVGNRVLAGSSYRSLFFLSATSGTLLRSRILDSEVRGLCALSDRIIAFTAKGAIYVLDFSGGTLLHRKLETPLRGSPLCFQEEIWFGSEEGFLFFLDTRKGRVSKIGRPLPPASSPLAYAPSLNAFFSGAGDFALYRIAREKPDQSQWIVLMTAPVDTPPMIGDSSLFAVDTSGVIRAFTFSGDLLWERKIPGVPRAPVLTREVLVVGSSSGVLTALRASDGAPLWQREGPPITSPLTFAGEGILFCREGRVELVSFEKGELLGTHPIPGRRCSEPVLYPGTVILSTDEGEVVAIGE